MNNYKNLIGAGLIALSFVIFFTTALPEYDAIKLVRDEIVIKREERDKKKSFVDKIDNLKKQVEARKNDLDNLNIMLPEHKNTQEVLVSLEDILRQTGVQIGDLKTGKTGSGPEGAGSQVIQVEADFSSSYQSFIDMLRLLEKNLRIFDIQELSLNKKNEGTGNLSSLLMNTSLKFNTYFIK